MFELMTQGILICFVSRRVRTKQSKQIIDVEGLERSNQRRRLHSRVTFQFSVPFAFVAFLE